MKLDIVIPVFNEENIILSKLTDLYKIKNPNKIILVNDGSNDKTENIIKDFIKDKENFYLINLFKNRGIERATLEGIKYSKANYVYLSAADDFIDKDIYKKFNLTHSKNPNKVTYNFKSIFIKNNSIITNNENFPKNGYFHNRNLLKQLNNGYRIFTHTCVFKRDILKKECLNFYFKKYYMHHDWLLTYYLSRKYGIVVSNETISNFHVSIQNNSLSSKKYNYFFYLFLYNRICNIIHNKKIEFIFDCGIIFDLPQKKALFLVLLIRLKISCLFRFIKKYMKKNN